jgi:hypothetical protein
MPIWTNDGGDFLWGNPLNWDTDTLPSATGAGTDAIFNAASPACRVNVPGVCRNLNFTGYANTITMDNSITVGSLNGGNPNHSVTLSAALAFNVAGAGALITRAQGITTLTSNGKTWPNPFNINTAFIATNSIIELTDNWNNGGNVTIGPGSTVTLRGAFSLTCNANLTVNVGATATSSLASGTGLSTIVLAGNSTYTSNSAGMGVNLTINAPGKTVILADGAGYGGTGTSTSSTFTYIAGTVVCTGTFHLGFVQGGTNYTLNLNGNPSTSANTTNTSGVNFNNLSFKTAATNNPSTCTFTSPVCVVNDLSVTTVVGSKSFVRLTGNTIHANKNFTVNGLFFAGSTTTIKLQGTGQWTESNVLGSGVTGFGVSGPVVIDTLGTITLGSVVGIRIGSLTLVNGSFITTGYGLRLIAVTLTGLGSGGAFIETLYHTTDGLVDSSAATITINDTAPLRIGLLTFDGFAIGGVSNKAHRYLGTAGWTCNDLFYQQSAGSAGADIGLVAEPTIEYRVKNSLILRAFNISAQPSLVTKRTGTAARALFTLEPGASQDVFYMGGRDVDSDAGQTIWSRKGQLTNTINWNLWTYPKTRFATFTN